MNRKMNKYHNKLYHLWENLSWFLWEEKNLISWIEKLHQIISRLFNWSPFVSEAISLIKPFETKSTVANLHTFDFQKQYMAPFCLAVMFLIISPTQACYYSVFCASPEPHCRHARQTPSHSQMWETLPYFPPCISYLSVHPHLCILLWTGSAKTSWPPILFRTL